MNEQISFTEKHNFSEIHNQPNTIASLAGEKNYISPWRNKLTCFFTLFFSLIIRNYKVFLIATRRTKLALILKTTANTILCLSTSMTKHIFSLKIAGKDVHMYVLLSPV